MKPVFESLAKQYSQRISFYVCSTDDGCVGSGISTMPTFAVFRYGIEKRRVRRVVGYDPTGLASLVSQALTHWPRKSRTPGQHATSKRLLPTLPVHQPERAELQRQSSVFLNCMQNTDLSQLDEIQVRRCNEALGKEYLKATVEKRSSIFETWERYADRFKTIIAQSDPVKTECLRGDVERPKSLDDLEKCRSALSRWLGFVTASFNQNEELVNKVENQLRQIAEMRKRIQPRQKSILVETPAVAEKQEFDIWGTPLNSAVPICISGA